MTQAQIARNYDIDLTVQTLHSRRLTISDVANHSARDEELSCIEIQDSISAQSFELAQTSNFKNDVWQVIPFLKLNLRMNMILNLNLVIQFYFLIQ